jgi:large subunit ribosomal protein L18
MTTTQAKNFNRIRRHTRLRAKISGTAERPRVAVFRSNQHTYVQVIDDVAHTTVVSVDDEKMKGTKTEIAGKMGEKVAEKMKEKGISEALFDRGGFKYHGRVKAVAEGLRAGGIKI